MSEYLEESGLTMDAYEAIEVLENYVSYYCETPTSKEFEAINIALAALKENAGV